MLRNCFCYNGAEQEKGDIMQPYPEHLATHERVQVFDLNDEVFHLYDHLAYFHTKEFPLFMHSHDFYELNIITEGRGRHYIEGNNFAAKPGDVFAVPPHIKHGYWADGDMSIFHLLIGEYMFTKFHKELVQFPGVHLLFEAEPLIRRNIDKVSLFLHLNEEQQRDFLPKMQDIVALAGARYEGANTIFEMRSICLICELAHFIADDYRSKYAGKDVHRESLYSIIPSTEYMNENFANHITLKDLAKRAMLSPASYMRYFKKLFGMTPIDYLIRLRVKHATEMLKNTEKSVAEIAQDCGFFDSSHLLRTFKQEMGITPSEYKNSVKK